MADADTDDTMTQLERELYELLNRHSAENESNTPDYVLARFMLGTLDAFNLATLARDEWYGKPMEPGSGGHGGRGSLTRPLVLGSLATSRQIADADHVHMAGQCVKNRWMTPSLCRVRT